MRSLVGRIVHIVTAGIAAAGLATAAHAQNFLPGVNYDPAIPTIESVLGKPSGERITPAGDVVKYFRALETAAPGRIVVRPYAESWQGRELVYVVIGSTERIASLDSFSAGMKRLSDPRATSRGEADRLIASLPASVWLAHGVHGDEISSSDASMRTAYHLLAARGDATVDAIFANTLVFIDPVQNPDGRDRFVNGFYDTTGLEPSGSPISAERDQPWPGGRFNHYLFDMNRDWFALTQPETRGRIAAFLDFMPLIFVDLHEMGSDSSYFFSPEADPFNPDITVSQRASLDLIGRNNARWFDRFGFDYYTREVFDAFYPGYGAAWPLFHGSIGTTYEQASARGLTASRADGREMTFNDTVQRHFTSSVATLETAAANRERLLRDFYAYRASAIDEGRSGDVRTYVLPPQTDQDAADRLARLLAAQGVEVRRASESFRACGRNYAAGAYSISLAQPAGRLVRTLMEPDVPLDEAFMKEQERRRAKGLYTELYDVTAWSLPLMFNVTTDRCRETPSVRSEAVAAEAPAPVIAALPAASYGYIAPWGSVSSVRLLAGALRDGLIASSTDFGFTHGGNSYPAGTVIFRNSENPDLAARLGRIAAESGANVVSLNDSWVTNGPSFGSDRVVRHHAPRIAIAWDDPVSPTSAGNLRYVIERQFGYPVTPVRTESFTSSLLSKFDVLILPDGRYGATPGKAGAQALATWTEAGGTLIAIDGAARFVANPDSGLSALRRENAWRADDAKKTAAEDTPTVAGARIASREELDALEAPVSGAPDSSPGALVRATPDADHWLAAGVAPQLNVLMAGSDIYAPLRRDAGNNVVSFAGAADIVASGYLWEETKQQLAFKPFVTAEPKGRGQILTFTQDPALRAYMDGLNVLLANALFRGPAHAMPVR